MENPRILLVEDDTELSELIFRLLTPLALQILHAQTLADARSKLASERFDAVVLDIMLPDGSGLDLCREIRMQQPALPVLMLSARGDTLDRVLGLEIGADDYLAKPFDAAELTARLRALLRRGRLDAGTSNITRRQYNRLLIDLFARTASIDGIPLDLTSTEYKLLLALTEQLGQPVTREALSRAVQPGAYIPSDRSVDVQVARLRKKLREADAQHDWVMTVRGEGYVFTLPTAL
jgi:DNA-binding response OmpR family regulator